MGTRDFTIVKHIGCLKQAFTLQQRFTNCERRDNDVAYDVVFVNVCELTSGTLQVLTMNIA